MIDHHTQNGMPKSSAVVLFLCSPPTIFQDERHLHHHRKAFCSAERPKVQLQHLLQLVHADQEILAPPVGTTQAEIEVVDEAIRKPSSIIAVKYFRVWAS